MLQTSWHFEVMAMIAIIKGTLSPLQFALVISPLINRLNAEEGHPGIFSEKKYLLSSLTSFLILGSP
jgi:hypothetical protein